MTRCLEQAAGTPHTRRRDVMTASLPASARCVDCAWLAAPHGQTPSAKGLPRCLRHEKDWARHLNKIAAKRRRLKESLGRVLTPEERDGCWEDYVPKPTTRPLVLDPADVATIEDHLDRIRSINVRIDEDLRPKKVPGRADIPGVLDPRNFKDLRRAIDAFDLDLQDIIGVHTTRQDWGVSRIVTDPRTSDRSGRRRPTAGS